MFICLITWLGKTLFGDGFVSEIKKRNKPAHMIYEINKKNYKRVYLQAQFKIYMMQ